MRKLWLSVALFGLGSVLNAADATPTAAAPAKPTATAAAEPTAIFSIRRIEFGAQSVDLDSNSSRFREYREMPSGLILTSLRFAGNEHFRYDLWADNVRQSDAHYGARLEPGPFDIRLDYLRITHRFGNDARSLLNQEGDRFILSDTLQLANQNAIIKQFGTNKAGVNFDFLNSLIAPEIAAASRINLALTRDRGRVDVGLTPKDQPFNVTASYFQERRYGSRASGTSFGFGNVVETGEPIEFRTRDFSTTAEWRTSWGLVRGGIRYNKFSNAYLSQTFDNPFRATDSTDASAYTGPASGSIAGPATGRIGLPPDNDAITGNGGVIVKLPAHTRVTADAYISRWAQDSPFMPYSTNTSITAPVVATSLSALPVGSLNGKMDVTSLSFEATSRPADKLLLTARYRRYDLDNKTPRITIPGYVRFDAVWEDIGRISVPYGNTTDRALVSASYDIGNANVEAGYRYDVVHRTFRETEKTMDGTVFGAVRWHPKDWALLRVSGEHASRDFSGDYETELSEDASIVKPTGVGNLPDLRRFDQAKKDTDRINAQLQLNPGGKVTVAVVYLNGKDNYKESSYGLLSTNTSGLTVDVDYQPTDRLSFYGYGARESFKNLQKGRQSGATVSTNPADDWTSSVKDIVDTYGGGLVLVLVKERLDLKVAGSYQKVNGDNALSSPPGGAPDLAVSIPLYDDTKLYSIGADLAYSVTHSLRLSLGGSLEQYKLGDSATGALAYYEPGGLFLSANDGDYKAKVIYAHASYVW